MGRVRGWAWISCLAAGCVGIGAYYLVPEAVRSVVYDIFGLGAVAAVLAGAVSTIPSAGCGGICSRSANSRCSRGT